MVGPIQQTGVDRSFISFLNPASARRERAPVPAQRQPQELFPLAKAVEEEKPDGVRVEDVARPVSRERTGLAIETLKKLFEGISGRLNFELIGDSSQLLVQVIDRKTNQVIRMMPPEEFLELKQRIDRAVGALIDEVV